jgi:hypothetical protein
LSIERGCLDILTDILTSVGDKLFRWYNHSPRAVWVSFRVSRENVGSHWLRSARYAVRRLSGVPLFSA